MIRSIISNLFGSKRKELLEQLARIQSSHQALKDRYTTLTNNLAASVIIREPSGHISYCSPYTLVLTGYSLAEIHAEEGDFFETIIHPEDREAYQKAMSITTLGESFQVRYRIVHKTGIEMWVETRTVPILNSEGETSGILGISFDVTASVRYQRQIEERNRDLQDLTYTISHDLRSPIVTIRGMSSALEQEVKNGDTVASLELLSHIQNATETLERLTSAIIKFFKTAADEASWEKCNLNEVLDEALASHAVQISKVRAKINRPSQPFSLQSDRTMLYQIISNLLGNAVKYGHPDRDPEITIDWEERRHSKQLALIVSDNGAGISTDKLQTIFRPFKRGDSATEPGFGIGLATVKKLTQKIGGSIEVQSSLGKGTTFTVLIPIQS